MVWIDPYTNPGGGPLYNPDRQPSQGARGMVSLSDPFPPPTSPSWSRKTISAHHVQSLAGSDLASPMMSPRSSATSEYAPRYAGGWLWWLGL
jgi:hypothetical protein